MTDSLAEGEAAAAAVQKTPHRASLEHIESKIRKTETQVYGFGMTLCVVTMENGFYVVGKSRPVDANNFDRELGEKFAYEDAVRQIWPLEGYLLRDQLYRESINE